MQRVKIFNENEGSLGTRCFVGEHELHGVRAVDFHISVEEVPGFTFEVCGLPDIDVEGEARIKFHPETLQDACRVLGMAYRNDEVFREAFLASCQSAIGDIAGDMGHEEAAKYLADYIMGVGE